MIQEYESFTSDLLAWIQQVKEQKKTKKDLKMSYIVVYYVASSR